MSHRPGSAAPARVDEPPGAGCREVGAGSARVAPLRERIKQAVRGPVRRLLKR
ncbi:hypothetical protein AB0F68_05420 [Micromonospora sp. NPDC023966]|uniref:hypothetical protein n=1 Tax=Micromonospora sp. NPDC023966 TaxID=3154699 RepID=UPI0033DC4E48